MFRPHSQKFVAMGERRKEEKNIVRAKNARTERDNDTTTKICSMAKTKRCENNLFL